MKRILCLGLLLVSTVSVASTKQEIETMLDTLRHSDCQFERGGTWYSGKRAAEHLKDKWDYAKDEVDSSETFIKEVASGSWLMGNQYHVKCQDTTTTSEQWLTEQLQIIRSKS